MLGVSIRHEWLRNHLHFTNISIIDLCYKSLQVPENIPEQKSRNKVSVLVGQMDGLTDGLAKHVQIWQHLVSGNSNALKKPLVCILMLLAGQHAMSVQ